MLFRRVRSLIVAASVVLAGSVVMWAGPAGAAAVACPTVAAGTGQVTPAPTAGVDWIGCDLAGADLGGAQLAGAYLTYANLSGANLAGADIEGAVLDLADLSAADLSGSDVENVMAYSVNFTGADLANVDMSDATVGESIFTNSDISGAELSGVAVFSDDVSGGVTGIPASLPTRYKITDGYLIGGTDNLTHADLAGANLTGDDLFSASLKDADLAGANLTGTDLEAAELSGADLAGANLADANLNLAGSGGISGTPVNLPVDWRLVNGYLIGPGAFLDRVDLADFPLAGADLAGSYLYDVNLTSADLAHANLSGASLAESMLAGLNLSGANLTGLSSGGDGGTPATLPAHWVERNGFLLGPGVDLAREDLMRVNLAGLDLAGGDLMGIELTGADLAGADLSGADLAKAVLKSADLAGADLFGSDINSATWQGARCPDGASAEAPGGSCANALAFRFAGFGTPRPGSTMVRSAKSIAVRFRLTLTSGAALSSSVGAALAGAGVVRVTLSGPGIKATSANCSWASAAGEFTCALGVPHGVKAGQRYSYRIMAAEKPGSGFATAPSTGKIANPESIHFR